MSREVKDMKRENAIRFVCAAALACILPWCPALGQDFPSRPITLVIAYPPGGSVDLIARLVAPKLSERLGQNVIVENIGGASGIIATKKVIAARPDGYTVQLGSGREINIAKLINPNVTYDALHDLTFISLGATTPMVLVGGPKLKGVNSIDDLLASARARPGEITFATSGIGSPQHLVGELINMRVGIDIRHIAYSGGARGLTEVMGGQVDLSIIVLSSALPQIGKRLKAFGVTEAKRSLVAPNIPALAETKSLADVDVGIWYGLLGPAKMPASIVKRLNQYFNEALKDPQVVAKLNEQSISPVKSSPAEFKSYVQADTERYRKIVEAAHIRVEDGSQ
jgi:tripartite-type tricarboxylate transporter receptor subunit TctC